VHLHSAEGIVAHIAARKPDDPKAAFTDLNLEKMKALNPEGIKNGVFISPKVFGNPAADAKQAAMIEHLKKILPAGTIIKTKQLSGHKIGMGEPKPLKKKDEAPVATSTPVAPVKTTPSKTAMAHIKYIDDLVKGGAVLSEAGLLAQTSQLKKQDQTAILEHYGVESFTDLAAKIFKGSYPTPPIHAPKPTPPQPSMSIAPPVMPVYTPSAHIPIPDPAHVKVLKTLPGSTHPKMVEDQAGNHWVMKSGAGKEPQLQNEAQADAIYRALQVPTPPGGLHVGPDGVHKFTRFIDGVQTLGDWSKGKKPSEIEAIHKQIGKNFALDALMANWDVVGLTKDNILVKDGVALRADNGGALLYRAQGAPKGAKFGAEVTELESMRNSSINPSTAAVYKHLTDAEVRQQMIEIVDKRHQILDAISDPHTKSIIEQRLTDFKNKLDKGYGISAPSIPDKPIKGSIPVPTGTPSQVVLDHGNAVKKLWTSEEMSAVQSYTGAGYASLNDAMRKCPPQFECVKGKLKTRMEHILSALDKAPPLPETTTVSRGIHVYGEEKMKEFLNVAKAARDAGADYQMPCISSTSVKPSPPMGGYGDTAVNFIIEAKTGVYVGAGTHVSHHPGEKEIIQSPKAKYRVINVIEKKGSPNIVHLQEVL
jgi:hypothetical protein